MVKRRGYTISSHGYVRIKMPDHTEADVAGYVYEHRLVAEKMLGRPLAPTEMVHHLNENKSNNRPENLEIVESIAEHRLHHRQRNDLRLPGETNPMITCACGCGTVFPKYDDTSRPRRFVTGHNMGILDRTEMVPCACGCGTIIQRWNKSAHECRVAPGHHPNAGKGKRHSTETVICVCGCGQETRKYDHYGRVRLFINGHNGRKR